MPWKKPEPLLKVTVLESVFHFATFPFTFFSLSLYFLSFLPHLHFLSLPLFFFLIKISLSSPFFSFYFTSCFLPFLFLFLSVSFPFPSFIVTLLITFSSLSFVLPLPLFLLPPTPPFPFSPSLPFPFSLSLLSLHRLSPGRGCGPTG